MLRLTVHKILVFCPMILFLITQAGAADMHLNFFSLTRSDGLSNNRVIAITRDNQGYLWFGTQSGLNRYNGYEFKQYYNDPGDSTSLPGSRIISLITDNHGDLWAGCHSAGLARYNMLTDNFTRYYLVTPIEDDAAANIIVDMEVDSRGRLWVATHGGLFLYDREKDDFTLIPSYGPADLINEPEINAEGLFTLSDQIASLAADDHGNIWVAHTDWSLSLIDPESGITTFWFHVKDKVEDRTESLTQVFYHENLLFFVGGHRGLHVYNPLNKDGYKLIDENVLQSPLYISGYGKTLWISSLDGLFRYDLRTGNYFNYTQESTNPKSITTGSPGVIYVDDNDILWLAAGNRGINYSLINMPFMNNYEHMDYQEFLYHPDVSAILHDSRGNLWVAFQSGIVQVYFEGVPYREIIPVDNLVPDTGIGHIFSLFEASDGTIFMTSWRGGLQMYDNNLKRFVNIFDAHWTFYEKIGGFDIRDVAEGPDGDLYLAVFGEGVISYDRKTQQVYRYTSDHEKAGYLSNPFVYDVEFDPEGNLWASTTWGLNRLPAGDTLFIRYLSSPEQGSLIDNYTMLSFRDRSGRMWFVTENGLNLYDPVQDSFVSFHVDDLGYTTLVIRSIEEDEHGHLWLATSHGIINISLDYTVDYDPVIRDVFIYDVSHGLLSDDFFTRSSTYSSSGLIYFGGNRGIDYFDPGTISPVEQYGKVQIENIRLFDRLVYPGSETGPPLNENGEILLSHTENMIGIHYAMLNFIDSPKNKYFYMLEPLHGDWIFAGSDRFATFANLSPGHYTFRVRSCLSDRLCDAEDAILRFYIKPPFWQTWLFYLIVFSLVIVLIYYMLLLRTSRLQKIKARLEKLVETRTHEITVKNRELVEKGEILTEANRLIKEKSYELEEHTQELSRQASELWKANEQLGELNSMKDKFFSIIAHDLRSPLSTIAGFSELLITSWDGYDDAKRKSLIEIVSEATRKTIIMLDNLLQWANSQTGRLRVKKDEVAPAKIIDEIHVLYREILKEKNISFANRVPGDLRIISDTQLLSVVFRNLISNAHKFTPPGGKIIVSSTLTDDERVCFDVTDTGVGFPDGLQEDIFGIDKASVRPDTEGKKGGGLGLILCHEFVSRLGGEIRVRETSEKGTTISFTLPIAGPPDDQAP